MGRICCVTNCKSNYRNNGQEHTTCFKFPSDEEFKQIWLKKIARPGEFNIENVGVCIQHFEIKHIKTVNEKGIPLKRPRLKDDAIPTIFNFITDGFGETINEDLIPDFVNFKNQFGTKLKSKDWLTTSTLSCVTLFKLRNESNGSLTVDFSVNIDSELNIQIFNENRLLDHSFYRDIIPGRQCLKLFSELNLILEKCENADESKKSSGNDPVKKFLLYALSNIGEAKRLIENGADFKFDNCINIIHDQLLQLTGNRRKYSLNTILYSYIIYIQSSKAYELIRENGILILPCKSTLKKMIRYQNVDPNDSSSNVSYLKKIAANLTEKEKYVVVQIDEIYSSPQVTYWNELIGFAENRDEVATTVLGVLVSSCFGQMKEIVNLIPMKDATGQDLRRYAVDVIDSLQEIGIDLFSYLQNSSDFMKIIFKVSQSWH